MFKNDLKKLDKLTRESSILESELIKKADTKILEVNKEHNDVLTNFEVKVSPSQSAVIIELVLSGSEMPDEFFDEIKDRLGASKSTRKLFDNNSKMRIAFIFE